MGENIHLFQHREVSFSREILPWLKIKIKGWPRVREFLLRHHWEVILSIGAIDILLGFVEHFPAVKDERAFHLSECILVVLLLLITGDLIRMLSRNVAERTEALNILRKKDELLLAQKVNSVQIEIARDLHDTIGQNISYLRMKLEYLSDKYPNMEISADILHMASVANESYDLVRGTLAMLQPNRSAHLHELFENHAQHVMERSGLEISVDCQGEPKQITTGQMRQLFYIFREALNNIEKHASASRVRVETNWWKQEMVMVISDNGRGFDPAQALASGHYGLKFMRERVEQINGRFDIWSKAGAGARVAVHIPYELEHS